jgi:uracil phosphoribosyltransferase/phosphoserine phosphatase
MIAQERCFSYQTLTLDFTISPPIPLIRFNLRPPKQIPRSLDGLIAIMGPAGNENFFSTMAREKPAVIGLYGVPGSGKSTLLLKLKDKLGENQFGFYEGSEVIASLVPGGLPEFQNSSEEAKASWRQSAIETIARESAHSGKAAVVTGHLMFWPEGDDAGKMVHTRSDMDMYTHIVYLSPPPEAVAAWRGLDPRTRGPASVQHLRAWQEAEKTELRRLCRENGILFTSVSDTTNTLDRIAAMLLDFQHHSEEYNLSCAKHQVDSVIKARGCGEKLQSAVVLDADRTLAAVDTGDLFWGVVATRASQQTVSAEDGRPLKALFSSPLGYTYTAFRQAMLLYEESADNDEFEAICEEVASSVKLHPEMLSLFRHIRDHSHVVAMVLTCGLRRVWEIVLARAGLSETVKVVGGGRISGGFVMTAEVKGALVTRMRDAHGLYIWAFGDSPLDLPMMHEAHQAIVVVGEAHCRSKTMDGELLDAVDNAGLRARQALLPSNAPPRLDTTKLPLVRLTDCKFLDDVVRRRGSCERVFHATARGAAKLLMTPTRDSRVFGPSLRKAHARVGWYLATEFLADHAVIGLEEYDIPHVQGHTTSGHRVRNENRTTIVALMRGGEPMADGVNQALPSAIFLHAKRPHDVTAQHIKGQWTVVLVDSVVNSGKSMVEFVQRIRSLDPTIAIVAVAGVVQVESLSPDSTFGQALETDRALSLVALRLSENRFQGRGGTDTGNRLFNTTQLD